MSGFRRSNWGIDTEAGDPRSVLRVRLLSPQCGGPINRSLAFRAGEYAPLTRLMQGAPPMTETIEPGNLPRHPGNSQNGARR